MSLSFIFLSKLYFMNSNRTHGSALNPDDSLPLALSQLQGLTLGPEPAALTVMTQRKKIILNVESVKSQCQQTISDILPPSKEFLVSPRGTKAISGQTRSAVSPATSDSILKSSMRKYSGQKAPRRLPDLKWLLGTQRSCFSTPTSLCRSSPHL